MITTLTQWYRQDKQNLTLRNKAMEIENKLTRYLRGILGTKLVAISTIYCDGTSTFYLSWNLMPDRLPGEEMLVLHTDLERQFAPNITDIRNLSHRLVITWEL
jgi:hypothetical protein